MKEALLPLEIKICRRLVEISSLDWNKLVADDNPFLSHEFLCALEIHGSVGENTGWHPCHVVIYENGHLKAAMPLYQKSHSSGEFVFDQAWAEAYHRSGLYYYPKLVCSVPHTPALGQRLLCLEQDESEMFPLLLKATLALAKSINASSFHCLFIDTQTHQFLNSSGLSLRHDCQFQWENDNYKNFDEFLLKLISRKRKNIKQERRKVKEAGITFRHLDGYTATSADWKNFYGFYQKTFLEKQNIPKLGYPFFLEISKKLPDQVFLVLADFQGNCVAGALMFRSKTRLYGRYWGCSDEFNSLHFEACYYQGIEYCIQNNLKVFEPGAQGEHKISRGFVPTLTVSGHWIADKRFKEPVSDYCAQERVAVKGYMDKMNKTIPFRNE